MSDDVEIALFGVTAGSGYDYDNESLSILRQLVGAEGWFTVTSAEYTALLKKRWELAQNFGFSELLILQRVSGEARKFTLDKVKELLASEAEAARREEEARERRREAARKRNAEKTAEKARKQIEKAQRTLIELGEKP
jgi:hypothetical protein